MRNHAAAMSFYAELAILSAGKRQPLARDRFVLLCGVEACRAGWLEVAARCFEWHNQVQPAHQLARYPSFPAALRDKDFQGIVAHWERWCHYEQAEHLLRQLDQLPPAPVGNQTLGEATLSRLTTSLLELPQK